MIHRSTEAQVRDYRERIGMNQSSLKVILKDGMQAFIDQEAALLEEPIEAELYKEKKHLTVGTAVDFNFSYGEETFNKNYFISQLIKKPGPKALVAIKAAFERVRAKYPTNSIIEFSYYKEEIFDACNIADYNMNRAKAKFEDDTRYVTLMKGSAQEYWEDLIQAGDRIVLSDEEAALVNSAIMSLRTNRYTAFLFHDRESVDVVFQFPIYWTYNEVDCKGLIDMIIIDHTKKRIMIVDFKTMSDYTLNFKDAVKRYRYDIQASYYTYGIQQDILRLANLINKPLEGYTFANLAFVIESTTRPGMPMIIPCTNDLINVGRHGNADMTLLGWEQAMTKYMAWRVNDFSFEKMLEPVNGVLMLDGDFDYTGNVLI